MSDQLAVVVAKPDTEAAIASLDAEGVYDDSRRIQSHDADHVAIPVTAAPHDTAVEAVVERHLPPRTRGLEDLLRAEGWTDEELDRAPSSWAVLGTVVLVDTGDVSADAIPRPEEVGEALLRLHGNADTVLARQGIGGERRTPDVTVLAGTGDTETIHTEHGTRYAMDLSRVMFSPGNQAERARMGRVAEAGERVFDMFAGIGYFTLPMARAGAEVTAVELNPTSYKYLVENAVLNGVEGRIDAFRGDCRQVEARADRVVMGYYDAYEYLDTALSSLKPGGVVHMHEATPEKRLWERPIERLESAAADHDRDVEILERRVVKSHSEGVQHVVVDARVG